MLISVLNKVHLGTDQIKPLQHPAYKEGKGRHCEGAEDGEELLLCQRSYCWRASHASASDASVSFIAATSGEGRLLFLGMLTSQVRSETPSLWQPLPFALLRETHCPAQSYKIIVNHLKRVHYIMKHAH